jgi:hypothetical protein
VNSRDVSPRRVPAAGKDVGAVAAIPQQAPATRFPEQAWIILGQDWEHNDEFFVPGGELAQLQLYDCESEAAAECLRLNEEFFATEPPTDYHDEMASYLESDTYDPEEVTWDQLRAAGYQGPFRVQALHIPHRKPPA